MKAFYDERKYWPKPVLKEIPWRHHRSGRSTGHQRQNGSSWWQKQVNLSKQSVVTLVDWPKHTICPDRFVLFYQVERW